MSDWNYLNSVRVNHDPAIPNRYWSESGDGFNGMFRFTLKGRFVRCLASDGMGWQHVSVSIERDDRCPTWEMMCHVKDLFWEEEDWVVQFHPPKSEYVNYHPGCLHLWKPTRAGFPTPESIMVGPRISTELTDGCSMIR